MKKHRTDLSIFNEFDFEKKPVGVKFNFTIPDGIEKLDKKIALCEMLKEAQETGAFYATKENIECKAALLILGMDEEDPVFESGEIGPRIGVFNDARANRRVYKNIPVLARNSVNYITFAPLDKLDFEPDLLILTATSAQAEIVLRALSYSTGEMWHSKGTPVIGCAWLFLHPYVSGELNFMVSGLYHGMKARNLFPEGLMFISIPFDLINTIVENLNSMEWFLPQYEKGKEAHVQNMKNIAQELAQEIGNEGER